MSRDAHTCTIPIVSPGKVMSSIFDYFHRSNGLPDPKGPLSSDIPPSVIAAANKAGVKAATNDELDTNIQGDSVDSGHATTSKENRILP